MRKMSAIQMHRLCIRLYEYAEVLEDGDGEISTPRYDEVGVNPVDLGKCKRTHINAMRALLADIAAGVEHANSPADAQPGIEAAETPATSVEGDDPTSDPASASQLD